MVNAELIKLVTLILVALFVGGGGQLMINRNRKAKKMQNESYSSFDSNSNSNLSQTEQSAKSYIEQYKSSYPKESLKSGLIGMGINDSDADTYLKKYF